MTVATKNGLLGRIYRGVLSLTIFLTIIQQFPVIRETSYGGIRIVLYALFTFFGLVGLARLFRVRVPRLCLQFIALAVAWLMECGLLYILGLRVKTVDMIELFIPLGLMIIGYTVRYTEKERDFLLVVYSVLAVIMGISLIAYYGSGFSIKAQFIAKIAAKNQTGPIVIMAGIMVLYRLIGLRARGKRVLLARLGLALLFFLTIAVSLIMRNRAGLAAFILVSLIMIFSTMGRRMGNAKMAGVFLSLILLVCLVQAGVTSRIIKPFYDSFTMNFDVANADALSSGRIVVYNDAISIIGRRPLLGLMQKGQIMPKLAHNYVLNKLAHYGFLGSLPLLLLYFVLVAFMIREFRSGMKRGGTVDLSVYLLMSALVISLVEYSYPYSPGVSLILVWFMLGQYLQKKARPVQKAVPPVVMDVLQEPEGAGEEGDGADGRGVRVQGPC